MARRFEIDEGNSPQFWECDTAGTTVWVRWGKIGATGQTQIKTHKSAAAAWRTLEELVAQRLKIGYREVTSSKGPPPAAPPPDGGRLRRRSV
jgi:predicted DNA-binding WGR domain protein